MGKPSQKLNLDWLSSLLCLDEDEDEQLCSRHGVRTEALDTGKVAHFNSGSEFSGWPVSLLGPEERSKLKRPMKKIVDNARGLGAVNNSDQASSDQASHGISEVEVKVSRGSVSRGEMLVDLDLKLAQMSTVAIAATRGGQVEVQIVRLARASEAARAAAALGLALEKLPGSE